MTLADLLGVKAKLERADEHFQAFGVTFERFLNGGPYAIVLQYDTDRRWLHFRWKVREPPPVELPLIFGDMLSNLRATLDYLAWQLVLLAGNRPNDRTAFPCVRERRDWASIVGDRLRGVDPVWISEIEKLQPYHRQDRPDLHPFAILDHVNNINKHRALPITIMTAEHWRPSFHGDLGGRTMRFQSFMLDPVKDGAEFFRVGFDPPLMIFRWAWIPTRPSA